MTVSMKTKGGGLCIVATVSALSLVVLHGRFGVSPQRGTPSLHTAAHHVAPTAVSIANQPLGFEINRGQTSRKVDFVSHGSGYSLFLRPTEAVFALARREEKLDLPSSLFSSQGATRRKPEAAVLRMEFEGADARAKAVGTEALPGKINYYLGNKAAKWRTGIPTYGKVEYRGLYPGIDLVYHGDQHQLEYDFVVAPKADPAAIRISFQGTKAVRLDANGDLILSLPRGEVRWQKPALYQEVGQERRPVDGAYVQNGDHGIGFRVAKYDTSRPLVIDPSLAYSTYLGGSGGDVGSGIAVDSSGFAYITGTAISTNFPDAGAPANDINGNPTYDAFVAKYNASGSLLGATYIGGSSSDYGNGIALATISGTAYVYIVGTTYPYLDPVTNLYVGSFPVTGGQPFNSQYGVNDPNYDTSDAFVATFYASNLTEAAAVYVGGSRAEDGRGIAIDTYGDVYITGFTNSYWGGHNTLPTPPYDYNEGFPKTNVSDVYQPDMADGPPYYIANPYGDVFVAHMTSALAVTKSTYIGAAGVDYGYGIATYTDSLGTVWVYVTGYANTAYPTTSTAYQTSCSGFFAFLTKIDNSLSHTNGLKYSTCLGGGYQTYGTALALDSSGKAYLTGYTYSGFPTTTGAFQRTMGGGFGGVGSGGSGGSGSGGPGSGGGGGGGGGTIDAFVSKIDPTQSGSSSLVYSTYLGGCGIDYGYGIAVDGSGNAYVTGSTTYAAAVPFPVTVGALHTTNAGGADVFMSKLNSSGSTLLYSTLMGGSSDDYGYGIALDSAGNPYVTGGTNSTNFPTYNAYQGSSGGSEDAFVFKLSM